MVLEHELRLRNISTTGIALRIFNVFQQGHPLGVRIETNREALGVLATHEAHIAAGDIPEAIHALRSDAAIAMKNVGFRYGGLLVIHQEEVQHENDLQVAVIHGCRSQQDELEALGVFENLEKPGRHELPSGHIRLSRLIIGLFDTCLIAEIVGLINNKEFAIEFAGNNAALLLILLFLAHLSIHARY